jgi:hypothetical protein
MSNVFHRLIATCALTSGLLFGLGACGNSGDSQPAGPDAAPSDAVFNGPVVNGQITPPPLPVEPPIGGTYESEGTCCQIDMHFAGPAGGTVTALGRAEPFKSPGLAMSHDGEQWTVPVCFPTHLTMYFHFLVSPAVGEPSTQINQTIATYESDEIWNSVYVTACDQLPPTL